MGLDKYRRDGTLYPEGDAGLLEWAADLEKGCKVARSRTIYGEKLSTVWLGLDHNFGGEGPPLIFETMLFMKSNKNDLQWRYSTEEEAKEGHRRAFLLSFVPPALREWRLFAWIGPGNETGWVWRSSSRG